jgi:hypothetical protein
MPGAAVVGRALSPGVSSAGTCDLSFRYAGGSVDECAPAFTIYLDSVFVVVFSRVRAPLRMSSKP